MLCFVRGESAVNHRLVDANAIKVIRTKQDRNRHRYEVNGRNKYLTEKKKNCHHSPFSQ